MKITTTKYNIDLKLNKKIKLLFISDLHDNNKEYLMKEINNNSFDICIFGGDFIHSNNEYLNGIDLIKKMSLKCPVIVSLGNHEMKFIGDIKQLIKGENIYILDDSIIEINDITFIGLTTGFKHNETQGEFKNTPAPNLEFLNKINSINGKKILLNHHPEYYDKYLKDLDVNLILSGHAHGGQWRIFNKGIFSPGQGIFPKYTSGIIDNKMIVSRGLSNKGIIPRINNKRELILIDVE